MGWILFTAIDLYLGLILIDVLARSESLPPEKLRRLAVAKKALIAALACAECFWSSGYGVDLRWRQAGKEERYEARLAARHSLLKPHALR